MREPHTSAFDIGFCLHGMYIRLYVAANMRPAQLVTHITCNYGHYVFRLLHVFTFEDISWEFLGIYLPSATFPLSQAAAKSETESP